jgi:MSHA biogenesis protein MshQ
MAGARINPTGGTSQVRILDSGGTMVPVATSAGAPPGSYTGVLLQFDAQSKAPLVFDYPDAGSIAIYARYQLPAPPAGTFVSGNSNTFVVRPFGLRVSGVTTSASPSPSDPAAYVAGQNFNVTLTAVAWKTGDDADANGVPDSDAQIAANPPTPNFGQETTPAQATLTHTLNAPSGGSAGTLGGATTFTGFSGGTKTQAVNWSEVGFVNLHAASTNYLGSGQNVTNSAAGLAGVGRFRPDHFAVSGASLANRTDKTCVPASTFTYLGEEFRLSFTLQARNAANAVTQNYTGTYAKLALGTFGNYNLGARSGTTGLTPRLSGLSATGSWTNGSAAVDLRALVSRAASPEAPFTGVEYGIAPVDSDSVAMNALDFDADANGTPERKKLDGVAGELRYGRIRLGNANGSELLDLPVPMRLEYYAGASGWLKNVDDSCSAIAASDFAFAFPADPKNQLSACETRAVVAGTAPNQTLVLEKPGAGNHGWTDLVLNLGTLPSGNRCTAIGGAGPPATTANMPYLQFKWTNPTEENPSARASFGMQPSGGPVIYRRERY